MIKLKSLAAITAIFVVLSGVQQVRAKDQSSQSIDANSIAEIRKSALDFISTKTDAPESDFEISPQGFKTPNDHLIISFVGEDFSDHASRIDRCYVALYDKAKKTLAVANRSYDSDTSEDSTPCKASMPYASGAIDNDSAWFAFASTYSNPQLADADEESTIEIYQFDIKSNSLCYNEKATNFAGQMDSTSDPSALKKAMESGTLSQSCNK